VVTRRQQNRFDSVASFNALLVTVLASATTIQGKEEKDDYKCIIAHTIAYTYL
jgi:hypothetical protein